MSTDFDRIAEVIRTMREQRGLSTRALARFAGVSQSLLSNIENGRALPSVRTLYALSEALGTGPGALLPAAEQDLSREHEHPSMPPDESSDPAVIMNLVHAAPDSALEVHLIRQRAGYVDPAQYRHPGEDLMYIVEGQVQLMCGSSRMRLGAGDLVWLDGATPHSFATPQRCGVTALIITARAVPGSV